MIIKRIKVFIQKGKKIKLEDESKDQEIPKPPTQESNNKISILIFIVLSISSKENIGSEFNEPLKIYIVKRTV